MPSVTCPLWHGVSENFLMWQKSLTSTFCCFVCPTTGIVSSHLTGLAVLLDVVATEFSVSVNAVDAEVSERVEDDQTPNDTPGDDADCAEDVNA